MLSKDGILDVGSKQSKPSILEFVLPSIVSEVVELSRYNKFMGYLKLKAEWF